MWTYDRIFVNTLCNGCRNLEYEEDRGKYARENSNKVVYTIVCIKQNYRYMKTLSDNKLSAVSSPIIESFCGSIDMLLRTPDWCPGEEEE